MIQPGPRATSNKVNFLLAEIRWSIIGNPVAHKHYKQLCYICYPLTACIRIICLNIIFSPAIRDACNIEIGKIQSWGDYKLLSPVTLLEPTNMSVFLSSNWQIPHFYAYIQILPPATVKNIEYKIFSCNS